MIYRLFSKFFVLFSFTFVMESAFAGHMTVIVAMSSVSGTDNMSVDVVINDPVDCDGTTVSAIRFELGSSGVSNSGNALNSDTGFSNYSSLLNAAQKGLTIEIDTSSLGEDNSGNCRLVMFDTNRPLLIHYQ